MPRLIIIPQYPASMRYQEWWYHEFPQQFSRFFDDILVINGGWEIFLPSNEGEFAPHKEALLFEADQIKQYVELVIQENDVLLLNDLSYPGAFANVLFHKRPERCFAICHATSKNRYDLFAKDRGIKYPIEKVMARMFKKIFVSSQYHHDKLGWDNLIVQPFPYPPLEGKQLPKIHSMVSVARPSIQKVTANIEKRLEQDAKRPIIRQHHDTWEKYYTFLAEARMLIITAKEETYGYQVIDAALNGCVPLAPNAMSYPELLPSDYLYNSYDDLMDIVGHILLAAQPSFSFMDILAPPPPKLLIEDSAKSFYERLSSFMLQI